MERINSHRPIEGAASNASQPSAHSTPSGPTRRSATWASPLSSSPIRGNASARVPKAAPSWIQQPTSSPTSASNAAKELHNNDSAPARRSATWASPPPSSPIKGDASARAPKPVPSWIQQHPSAPNATKELHNNDSGPANRSVAWASPPLSSPIMVDVSPLRISKKKTVASQLPSSPASTPNAAKELHKIAFEAKEVKGLERLINTERSIKNISGDINHEIKRKEEKEETKTKIIEKMKDLEGNEKDLEKNKKFLENIEKDLKDIEEGLDKLKKGMSVAIEERNEKIKNLQNEGINIDPLPDPKNSMLRKKAEEDRDEILQNLKKNRNDKINQLLTKNININELTAEEKNDLLRIAAQEGQIGIIKLMPKEDLLKSIKNEGEKNPSLLHLAAGNGHLDIVKHLHESGADLNIRRGRKTPLDSAVLGGHFEEVKYLLDNKAEIISDDRFKKNALHHAVKLKEENSDEIINKFKIINILLENGAEMIPEAKGMSHLINLRSAFDKKEVDTLSSLIEEQADIHIFTTAEQTQLLFTMVKAKKEEAVKALLDEGIELDVKSKHVLEELQFTTAEQAQLLLTMVKAEKKEEVKALLDGGIELDVKNQRVLKELQDEISNRGWSDIVEAISQRIKENTQTVGIASSNK